MRSIRVSEDVIPLGEFKANAASLLRRLVEQHSPMLITQNGQAAGVLMAPAEYDAMCEKQAFFEAIAAGLADVEAGRVMSLDDVKVRLAGDRAKREAR